jgi:hypothetical protein
MAFFKKLRLRQILTVFLAGVLLVVSTACNTGNVQGARPNNLPVQAGGANNPYKSGGDGYTDLKMSTDPKVSNPKAKSGRDQANLQLNSNQLIAADLTRNKESELLYPGAEEPAGRALKEAQLPIKTSEDFMKAEPGGLNQQNENLGERIQNRVETATEAFKKAGAFVKEKSDEAGERPEFQSNPARH